MNWPVMTLFDTLRSAEIFIDGDWVESKDQDPNGDVRLIQLADVGDGVYVNKSSRFLTSAKARELRCTFLRVGDILVSRMPEPLGRACVFPGDSKKSVTVVDVCVIRPDPEQHDARWLMHSLNSPACRNQALNFAIGTTRSRISRMNLGKIAIPVPPLPEQRRIATILDQVEALRANRREALDRLDELTQSTFLDMFSRPHSDDWTMTTVARAGHADQGSIRTGPFGSQLLHSEFVDSGIAVLGIDNVVTNEFRWVDRRYVTEAKYRELNRYTVRPGDVLITIMGTCGRCAVVPEDIPLAINTKHLCCITLDRERCLPVFLHAYFLRHPAARRYLNQTAKGAIMSGLNMGIIKAMPLLLPPLPLQQDFVDLVEGVERLKVSHRAHLAELDALFASLQYRAFRGEL